MNCFYLAEATVNQVHRITMVAEIIITNIIVHQVLLALQARLAMVPVKVVAVRTLWAPNQDQAPRSHRASFQNHQFRKFVFIKKYSFLGSNSQPQQPQQQQQQQSSGEQYGSSWNSGSNQYQHNPAPAVGGGSASNNQPSGQSGSSGQSGQSSSGNSGSGQSSSSQHGQGNQHGSSFQHTHGHPSK